MWIFEVTPAWISILLRVLIFLIWEFLPFLILLFSIFLIRFLSRDILSNQLILDIAPNYDFLCFLFEWTFRKILIFQSHLVVKWDTCSWKGQLERTRSWKVSCRKVWSWKVWLKLKRAKPSYKESSEVGKNRLKLERTDWSWKEPSKFGKNRAQLESFAEIGKFRRSWKVLAEVGKFEWTWKVVTDVGKFIIISK